MARQVGGKIMSNNIGGKTGTVKASDSGQQRRDEIFRRIYYV
jgi:hypothetical protein